MLMGLSAEDVLMATAQIKSSKVDFAIGIANSQASLRKMISHLIPPRLCNFYVFPFTEIEMLLDSSQIQDVYSSMFFLSLKLRCYWIACQVQDVYSSTNCLCYWII